MFVGALVGIVAQKRLSSEQPRDLCPLRAIAIPRRQEERTNIETKAKAIVERCRHTIFSKEIWRGNEIIPVP